MNKLQELKKVIDEGYDWYFKNTDGYCKSSEGWIEIKKLEGSYFGRRDKEIEIKPFSIYVYSYVFCKEGRRIEFNEDTEDEALQKAIDYFKEVIDKYIKERQGVKDES